MTISGHQDQLMFKSAGCNPKIIFWDRSALLFQGGFQLSVEACCFGANLYKGADSGEVINARKVCIRAHRVGGAEM